MYENIALMAIFIFIYSSIAGVVERSWFSGPIVFICFGLLIGDYGLNIIPINIENKTIGSLAEITLALVLFLDAAAANTGVLKKASMLPSRLLLIALPLTLLLGFGFGVLIFDEVSFFMIAILATILAPTDAALGKGVITNKSVPAVIRETLNVESGLNDGICVPILFLFMALALGQVTGEHTGHLALSLFLEEIGIGLLVGLIITFVGVQLLKTAWRHQWLTKTWIQIPVVALALICFTVAQYFGGSGFIAAFCGGLLFGILEKDMRETFLHSAEGTSDVFALITWVIFGAAIVGKTLVSLSWPVLLYALLSLTVIRMLPVYISLIGSGVSTEGKLFIGWFGPRGLASIVFAVIVLDSNLPENNPIILTVTITIILSVILHGNSANVWANAYGKRRRMAKKKAPKI